MTTHDLLIRGAHVVRPGEDSPRVLDVAVTEGRISAVEEGIDPATAATVVEASGRHLFPGVVDAHQHWGIYNPLPEDTTSESRASAQGGVTTGLTYIRTGAYYMNTTGPYREVFPQVLAAAEGRAYVDYGFHLAPILQEHIEEIPALIEEFGVPYPSLFDPSGRTAAELGFPALPDTYVVDPQGTIRWVVYGETDERELAGLIDDVLG